MDSGGSHELQNGASRTFCRRKKGTRKNSSNTLQNTAQAAAPVTNKMQADRTGGAAAFSLSSMADDQVIPDHIPALISFLEDPEGRNQAAAALASSAARADLHSVICEAGLPAISRMLQAASPEERIYAASILRQIAGSPDLRQPITDAALHSLVSLLEDTSNPEARANAAGVLSSLAGNAELLKPVADAALPALMSALKFNSTSQEFWARRGRSEARWAVWNLGRDAAVRLSIAQAAVSADLLGPLDNARQSALYSLLRDFPEEEGSDREAAVFQAYVKQPIQQPIAAAALGVLTSLLKDASDPAGRTRAAGILLASQEADDFGMAKAEHVMSILGAEQQLFTVP
ncbi:hypothetical protein WJX73_004597 [Symbiochloris irregularis]|uniref:Vacuolar protein 8 n=1 Tax=Symbiochloris irregularis TaxID=706552 RepID=A0AAW1P427_9CHLO